MVGKTHHFSLLRFSHDFKSSRTQFFKISQKLPQTRVLFFFGMKHR